MSDALELSRRLRALTPARVGLARAGESIALRELLNFQLAHAHARDAVRAELHVQDFARGLAAELPSREGVMLPVVVVESQAADRTSYLRRPDLGRALHPASAALLEAGDYDLSITIADGLSALAAERNAIPLLQVLLPLLHERGWSVAPVTVVRHGRVAIADVIGKGLGARCSLILIGERPGLTSADSLGAYLTWSPGLGRTDADRNCISNIRESGLAPKAAAARLFSLLEQARATGITGTLLKEGNGLLGLE